MDGSAVVDDRTQDLSGRKKAAVLCMLLGTEKAAQITQRLTPDEVETISYEIARLEHVNAPTADSVLREWSEIVRAADSLAGGGFDYAKEILEKAFGAGKAREVLKRIQAQLADSAGLHRLRNADPQQLGATLRGEHPQTIGLILAHLEPPHTAAVLREIPATLGSEVILRMARMEKVSPEMLQLIERSLGNEADLTSTQGMSTSGGPQAVAAVLNLINPSLEKELLDGVAAHDPDLCTQIKNLMFVFEDLVRLEDRSLQRLLREVDSKALALALKVASEELKEKIMGGMSQRAVTALREEMEYMGPVKLRDVEAAQAGIVAEVRALEEAGELVIAGGGDEMVIA
jgi:flagellar motor switch protein FliG